MVDAHCNSASEWGTRGTQLCALGSEVQRPDGFVPSSSSQPLGSLLHQRSGHRLVPDASSRLLPAKPSPREANPCSPSQRSLRLPASTNRSGTSVSAFRSMRRNQSSSSKVWPPQKKPKETMMNRGVRALMEGKRKQFGNNVSFSKRQ